MRQPYPDILPRFAAILRSCRPATRRCRRPHDMNRCSAPFVDDPTHRPRLRALRLLHRAGRAACQSRARGGGLSTDAGRTTSNRPLRSRKWRSCRQAPDDPMGRKSLSMSSSTSSRASQPSGDASERAHQIRIGATGTFPKSDGKAWGIPQLQVCNAARPRRRHGRVAARPDRRRAATLSVAWRTSCRVTTPTRRQQSPRSPACLANTSDRTSGILLARRCVGGKSWAVHRGSTQAAVVTERRTTSSADAIPPTPLRHRRGPARQNRFSGAPQPEP